MSERRRKGSDKMRNDCAKCQNRNNCPDAGQIGWCSNHQPVNDIMVSIVCITYNHCNFIRDAIRGFLMQEVNFPIEILVHDDASTDGTAHIIRKYAHLLKARHECRIVLQTQNTFSKTGLYPDLIPLARGKYIAYCEGDDYWTDPRKLQKQVDFMEAHPEYSMCHHDYLILSLKGQLIKPPASPRSYTAAELIGFDNRGYGIATCTKMARNYYNQETAKDYSDFRGDYPMNVLMGHFGPDQYIPGIQPSVYRKHQNSSWASLPRDVIVKKTKKMHRELFALVAAKGNAEHIELRRRFING